MGVSSLPTKISRGVCIRGRTQVEAGSRTVLGIGPGVFPTTSDEILPLTFSPPPCSASRIDKPSNGTSPVTLDTSDAHAHYSFLHRVLLITSLVQYTSPVQSTGRPVTTPFLQERCQELHHFSPHFAAQNLPFFIVLERLNAAEMSVTCLDEVLQPNIK